MLVPTFPAMSSDNTHEHHGDWYEIRIQGRLDGRWSTWLDDLNLSYTHDGATVLRGRITDQAALHGLLHKVRDLGLPLLSVARTEPDHRAEPPLPPHPAHLRPS